MCDGHVPCVRHGRRDAGIAPRRRIPFRPGASRRWNEVMRHARMLPGSGRKALQNRRGFGAGGNVRSLSCAEACSVTPSRPAPRSRRDSVAPSAPSRHCGHHTAIHRTLCGPGNRRSAPRSSRGRAASSLRPPALFRVRPKPPPTRPGSGRPQGVAEVVHRHAPICHRAGRILLENPFERLRAYRNQYECSMATPRSKLGLHIGIAEVGKLTLPSLSSCGRPHRFGSAACSGSG